MAKKPVGNRHLATIADYQKVFGGVHGKKVLRHLMKMHGMMVTSHVDGNPYATAFNEGGRNVVIQILNKLRTDLNVLEKEILQQPEGEDDYVI